MLTELHIYKLISCILLTLPCCGFSEDGKIRIARPQNSVWFFFKANITASLTCQSSIHHIMKLSFTAIRLYSSLHHNIAKYFPIYPFLPLPIMQCSPT